MPLQGVRRLWRSLQGFRVFRAALGLGFQASEFRIRYGIGIVSAAKKPRWERPKMSYPKSSRGPVLSLMFWIIVPIPSSKHDEK